ncbi:hypothetical protein VaNZ11_002241 [Volvox africanus]|uniref:Uncharacterized protein n=1 Tax=Volvox africanus TaxID=51714 RepID=A0ABQ5RSF5_9CHLO|nr:hypothetical protein VaNZ11_002241 [Volvox africanus]
MMKRFALALFVCTVLAFPRPEARDVPRINTTTAGRKGKDRRGDRGNDGTTALRSCADSSSDCIRNHSGHATNRLRQTQVHHNTSSHNSSNSGSDNSSTSSNSCQRQAPYPRGGSLRGSATRGAAKTLRGNGRGGGGDQGQLPPPFDRGGNGGATTATIATGEDLRLRRSVVMAIYRQHGDHHRRQVLHDFAYPQYPPHAPELPGAPPQLEPPPSAPPPLEPPLPAPLPAPRPPAASQSAPILPPVGASSSPPLLPPPAPPPPAAPAPAPPYPGNASPRPPGALVPPALAGTFLEQVPPPLLTPAPPAYASQWATASVAPAAARPSSGSAEPNGPVGLLSALLPPPPLQKLSTVASRNEPPLLDSPILTSPLQPPPYYLTVHRRGMAKFDAILAATAGAVGLILLLMFVFMMLRIRKALRSRGHNNSACCVMEAALVRAGGGGTGAIAVVRPFKGVAFDLEGVTDAEMSPMRFIGSGPAAAVPVPTGKKEMGSVIKPRSIVRGGTVTGVAGMLSSKKLGGSAGGAAATGGGVAAGVNLDMCHNLLYDMYDTDNSPDIGRRGVPPALQRHMAAQSSGGVGRIAHGGGGSGGGAVCVPVRYDTEHVVRRLTADMSLPSPHGYSAAARTVASRTHESGRDIGPMGQCSGDTTARRGSLDQNSASPDDQNTKGRGTTEPTAAKSRTTAAMAAAAANTRRRTTNDEDAYAVLVVGRYHCDSDLAKGAGGRELHSSDSDGEHRPSLGEGRGRGLTPRSSIGAIGDVEAAVRFTTTRCDVIRHTGNTHGSGVSGRDNQLDSCNGGGGGGGGGSAAARARVRHGGLSEGGAVDGGRTAAAPRGPARGASSYAGVPPVGGASGAAAAAIAPAILRLKRPPRTSSGGGGSYISNGGMATARSVSQPASSSASHQDPPQTASSAVRGGVPVPWHVIGSAAGSAAASAPTPAASPSPVASAVVPTARRRYHTDGNGDVSGSDVDDIAATAADTGANEDENEGGGDGDGDGDSDGTATPASEVVSASLLRRLLVQSGQSGGLFLRRILASETAAAAVVGASKPSPRATLNHRPMGRSISLLAAAAASNDGGCGRKPGGAELNAMTLGSVSHNESSPRTSSAREKPVPQRHRLSQSSGGHGSKEYAVRVVDVKKANVPMVHTGVPSGKVTASGGKDREGEGDGISSNDSNEFAVDVEAVQQPLASASPRDQQPLPPPPPPQQQRFRRPPPR